MKAKRIYKTAREVDPSSLEVKDVREIEKKAINFPERSPSTRNKCMSPSSKGRKPERNTTVSGEINSYLSFNVHMYSGNWLLCEIGKKSRIGRAQSSGRKFDPGIGTKKAPRRNQSERSYEK